jgi:F-type H+-transporting ATPase subunit a
MVFSLPRIKSLCRALWLFGLFLFFMPLAYAAQENPSQANAGTIKSGSENAEKNSKEFNAGEMIIEHIVDAHEWHIAEIGSTHISIPLPVILYSDGKIFVFSSARFHHGEQSYNGFKLETEGKNKGKIVKVLADGITADESASLPLDFSISKNVMSLFISVALLMIIFLSISRSYTRRKDHAPKGLQSLFEPLIMFIRDDIARPSIGEKRYMRYMPFLLTLFFFIFLNNLMGLVPFFPGGANLTGNIAVTMVLALFTFFITSFSGNKDYWKHIINAPGVPWWLKFPVPLMPIVEIVGVITKPFVLMVRLFANMTAGHIIVLGFMSLIFIFGKMNIGVGLSVTPVSVGFSVFMGLLELLVAFIQAYVFTLLSAIYFGMASEEHAH